MLIVHALRNRTYLVRKPTKEPSVLSNAVKKHGDDD